MSISLTITVANEPDVNPPPPDPDPGPGTPPGTTTFIDHAATLSQRNAMVAAHTVGTGDIGFTGITDTTGFTTYTCVNAEELRTALAASATTATTKKLITCNWNGVSTFAGSSIINGPGTANLTAYVNGAVDVGYDPAPHYTKIVAGGGFSPVLGKAVSGTSSESLNLVGFGYVEIDGLDIQGHVYLTRQSTRPLLPIIAIRNCTLNGLLFVNNTRTAHIVDNVFDGVGCGVRFGGQYCRFWNNETKNKSKDADFATNTNISDAYKTGWNQHIWVAGNVMHSMDEFGPSPNHYDWFQYGIGSVVAVSSINMLVEFNVINNSAPDTQAFFADGSPSPGGNNYEVNICAHNNIITVNAFWAMVAKDPTGTGEARFYRNTALRAAGKTIAQETGARIAVIFSDTLVAPTTGVYEIRENYGNSFYVDSLMAPATTVVDNLQIYNSGATNYVADVFTGNGTWSTSVNAPFLTYDDPGAGLSKAAAFSAIRNFFMPIGGYRVDGYGCTDPNTWPATPATLT